MNWKTSPDKDRPRLRGRQAKARRLRVWTAACGVCAKCGMLTNYPDGFEADHRVPLHKDGLDDESNLQVLCAGPGTNQCHREKTASDMGHREPVRFDAAGQVIW